MGSRGRKSKAELTVLPAPTWSRPAAPSSLDARGKKRWSEIVDNYPADHFRPADLGLLENFIWVEGELEQMRARVKRDGRMPKGRRHPLLVDVHQFVGNLASLAVKLRLSPSTRMREDRGSVNNRGAPPAATEKSRKPLWQR